MVISANRTIIWVANWVANLIYAMVVVAIVLLELQ